MGKLTLTEMQKRVVSLVMAAVAAFMVMDIVYQVRMHAAWNEWIAGSPLDDEAATTQPAGGEAGKEGDDKKDSKKDDKKKKDPKKYEMHASVKKRNIYEPVKREKHGLQLTGIIDKTAYFNKGSIEEGKSGLGVKLVKIDGFEVTIEYKGKEEKMRLFDKKPGDSGPSRPSRSSHVSRSRPTGPPPEAVIAKPGDIKLHGGIPPEHLEKIRAQMRKRGMPEGIQVIQDGNSIKVVHEKE